MGFKLGKNRGLEATGGEIKTKMRFGKEAGGDASIPGTPIIRKPLEEGVLGEANMDGSIYVNETINPNSEEYKQVVNHEMRHSTDMKIGKLAYGDDFVKYNGITYPRETTSSASGEVVDELHVALLEGHFYRHPRAITEFV